MAINFEAANMAGYNNPKIEVFKATLAADGTSLAQYPDKSIILNCTSRGSIPVIILQFETAGYLLMLSYWDTGLTGGTTIVFSTLAGTSSSSKIQITYPEDDKNSPTVLIE